MATTKKLARDLILQETLCEAYFSRIQTIYNKINVSSDNDSCDEFISLTETIDNIRDEFMVCLCKINSINLEIDPEYRQSYVQWNSFEDICCKIKYTRNMLIKSSSSTSIDRKKLKISLPKLPPIEIPEFHGHPNEWNMFYETFKTTIHNNAELSNSEKLYYLLGKLKNKAQLVFSGITPNADNYNTIWESLVNKYQDKRLLASTCLDQIFGLNVLPNPASASQLEAFTDKLAASVAALHDLRIKDLADFIFIHFALKHLDKETSKAFEMSIRNEEMPTYSTFISFLKGQAKILYRTDPNTQNKNMVVPKVDTNKPKVLNLPKISHAYVNADSSNNTITTPCSLCKGEHTHLYHCKSFNNLSPDERFRYVKDNRFCTNCLSGKHMWSACGSAKGCRTCGAKHHSLLHMQKPYNASIASINNAASSHYVAPPSLAKANMKANQVITPVSVGNVCVTENNDIPSAAAQNLGIALVSSNNNILDNELQVNCNILLGTARINVLNRKGQVVSCRCLIDGGSQNHFITTDCCRKLGLSIEQLNHKTIIKGLSNHSSIAKGKVRISFSSRIDSEKTYVIEPLVLNRITDKLPSTEIDVSSFNYLKGLPLADDKFGVPGDIDILLGAKIFIDLLLPGKVIGPRNMPSAFSTTLGYVVMGEMEPTKEFEISQAYLATTESIHDELSKFFELDDFKDIPILSVKDKACEEFYASSTTRDEFGRFTVGLPFRDSTDCLGDSLKTATKRFLNLERKFNINPAFKSRYDEVLRDYLDKDYLREIPAPKNGKEGFTLPHHGLVREEKSTSKLRIVLDASAQTDSGKALNDILHVGPPLQTDLFNILLNFRLFKFAFSADIRQMYLQIIMREQDCSFQQIIYRFNSRDPLKYYAFQRVCFGLCSSPYLALRTIHELAKQEGAKFPLASQLALRDLYVDDIVSSFSDSNEATEAAHQLIQMFRAGGFDMVKWSSNSHKLLASLPESHRLTDPINLDKEDSLKILGMQWLPSTDNFIFTILPSDRTCTKRNILSTIARFWDILGLVGPVIVFAKLLIKELWSLNIDWDETPPEHIIKIWSDFQIELPLLSDLKFPRHLKVSDDSEVVLLGFSDASERALGAVVYLHNNNNGTISTTLVCAKSKVAPVKVVTLARLELCASLLLAKLLRAVIDNFQPRVKIKKVYAFSDSTVTLNWIYSSPHRFQTYVANRISKIQNLIPAANFYHIPGRDNPSDCLSRGLMPSQLINHPLWFHGPSWINQDESQWPIMPFKPDAVTIQPEIKSVTFAATIASPEDERPLLCQLASRISSWKKLLHTVVYIYRFLKQLPRRPMILTEDLKFTENKILIALQSVHFKDELQRLNSNKLCSKQIQKLKPFLNNGLIHVGGRLSNADIGFDQQHPVLLPRQDHIVDLIVDHYHRQNCHTGPNLLLSLLRQQYWILTGRRTVRTRIDKCNFCFRFKPKPLFPLMADLPPSRVNRTFKAFTHTGCDFAGPLNITLKRGRGIKSQKAYISLFVCMTTRSIHLETTTSLSTPAFIDAFKRFLSRRGPVSVMYTDNGTNFIGAKSYLNDLFKFIMSESFRSSVVNELSDYKIDWKFIPPNAPHFGAWESMIKSVKSHLFRVIGTQILTYEELSTILCQIENVINSRPLVTTLSQDPSEPLALTPAHFLTMTPLKFLPAAPVDDQPPHLLERYQLLDKLVQSFWDRWSLEYLNTLQTREKWNTPSSAIKIGTVVVIIQDGKVAPLQWELGVITEVHPGKDGIIRVATVKTVRGNFKRPVVRLCPLPSQ